MRSVHTPDNDNGAGDRLRALRLLRAQMRQLIGYMPPGTNAAQRGALLALFMLDDGDEHGAVISHGDLGELGGYSASTSYRATKALEQGGHIASKPRFRAGEDHSQAANSYAVLAFEALERELVLDLDAPAPDHPVKMQGGLGSVTGQQKEISEDPVLPPAPPVDNNCAPVDDPTPEDRAALAAAVRDLNFPKRENLPDPEPGSPCAEVLARWNWKAYSDVLDVLRSPLARGAPQAVPLAFEALLRRPRSSIDQPGAYLRGALKRIVQGGGPGLRSTRPAPDTPAPGSIADLEMQLSKLRGLRDSCLGDPARYQQLNEALFRLGREILAQKAGAS